MENIISSSDYVWRKSLSELYQGWKEVRRRVRCPAVEPGSTVTAGQANHCTLYCLLTPQVHLQHGYTWKYRLRYVATWGCYLCRRGSAEALYLVLLLTPKVHLQHGYTWKHRLRCMTTWGCYTCRHFSGSIATTGENLPKKNQTKKS